jgi:putative SOS response-associated peptidase YedK
MRLATFNACTETVATRPMFRDAFKSKRCLIPGRRQATVLLRAPGWSADHVRRPVVELERSGGCPHGTNLLSCAMVITEPHKFVAEVDDHMPVILEAKDFEQWEHGVASKATQATIAMWREFRLLCATAQSIPKIKLMLTGLSRTFQAGALS